MATRVVILHECAAALDFLSIEQILVTPRPAVSSAHITRNHRAGIAFAAPVGISQPERSEHDDDQDCPE
jgi:hypothetical protein